MSLMAVLVKIIRSDVRVSFVSRPVSQSRQPSRSVMVVVPTISRYKDYKETLTTEENGMEISLANPSSIIIIIVRHLFPRVSKINKGMILSSSVDFLLKRIHLKDPSLRDTGIGNQYSWIWIECTWDSLSLFAEECVLTSFYIELQELI